MHHPIMIMMIGGINKPGADPRLLPQNVASSHGRGTPLTADVPTGPTDRVEANVGRAGQRLIANVSNPLLDGTPPVTTLGAASTDAVVPSPEEYNADLATHLQAIEHVLDEATPVDRSSAEMTASIAGSLISLPTEVVSRTCTSLDDLAGWAWDASVTQTRKGGWRAVLGALQLIILAPTRVVTGLAKQVDKMVDAPLALLRKGLNSLGARATKERLVPRDEAKQLRVTHDQWPELPANQAVNQRVDTWVNAGRPGNFDYDVIVVPGFTSDDETAPLSDEAKERLDLAVQDLRDGKAPFLMVSGGNCHPPGTSFNEAYEMKRYLVEHHGVDPDQIILEPLAQHSTTNMRNAGRYMQRMGLDRALVTTNDRPVVGQSSYFGNAESAFYGFHMRSLAENGARFGDLTRLDRAHNLFVPSDGVHLSAPDQSIDP